MFSAAAVMDPVIGSLLVGAVEKARRLPLLAALSGLEQISEGPVCTGNLNADIVMMKSAEYRV